MRRRAATHHVASLEPGAAAGTCISIAHLFFKLRCGAAQLSDVHQPPRPPPLLFELTSVVQSVEVSGSIATCTFDH